MTQFWYCGKCSGYNDGLNSHCIYCCSHKPDWLTVKLQAIIEIRRDIYLGHGIYGVDVMTEDEEKFSRFWNAEKVFVSQMTDAQLDEHHETLREIAFEAKARVMASDDEKRERRAKNGRKEWTLTDNVVDSSDALNAPKLRATRMSKLDKIQGQLLALGLDESIVKDMMREMSNKAKDSKVKTVTFKKSTEEITAVEVKEQKEIKPFDASQLKFGGN